MYRSYHRWLLRQEQNVLRGVPGSSASTDDLLDKMEDWFKEPRAHLKEVLGAWDGTAESVGERG